jgi:carbon starvation protein CstA
MIWSSLFASSAGRRDSLAVARDETARYRLVASLAVWLILILVMAVWRLWLICRALAESAWGTFTVAATIPLALFMVPAWMNKSAPANRRSDVIGVVD